MFIIVVILCSLFIIISSESFSCRDEDDKDVDWPGFAHCSPFKNFDDLPGVTFLYRKKRDDEGIKSRHRGGIIMQDLDCLLKIRFYMYKIPKVRDSKNKLVQDGLAYAFITERSEDGWTLSKKSLNDETSVPGNTLAPLYEDGYKKILYFLYNDQPPNKNTKSTGGHAKGVVVAGETGGFWLIHSVPKFAPPPTGSANYKFPDSGHNNGQSFLCITLKPSELQVVGKALLYNELNVYAYNVPRDLEEKYPNLADVAEGERLETGQTNIVEDIESAGGKEFRVFAKSSKWGKELYTDMVAPELETDLVTQTWPNSRGHQKSSCSKKRYNVENIDETNIEGITFTSTKDHSKWAASAAEDKPWVCVGDINKDDSQAHRGGGTVCSQDKAVWEAYYDSTEDIQGCDGKRPGGKGKLGANPLQQYTPYWDGKYWKDVVEVGANNKPVDRFIDVIGPFGR